MAPSMRSSTASSGPSEPYSPTANAFPRQVGAELHSSRGGNGFLSPNPSSLSSDPEDPRSTPMSDRGEEKQILRKPGRGAPGDSSLIGVVRNQEGTSLAKRKSQFYGEVFSYRESNISARNKVHQYSVITAEVKTNIIVKDEYVFLTELSEHLSQRYNRPASSIFITLAHSACVLFAGTFDSAYILTITALPSQIQPTTNKRNAALMQNFMGETLGVPPDRGIVRFIGVAEEYLATNGVTILGEIEKLSKNSSDDSAADSQSRHAAIKGRASRRTQLKPKETPLREHGASDEGAESADDMLSPLPSSRNSRKPSVPQGSRSIESANQLDDNNREKVPKRLGKRKSFLALFGKS